VWWFVLVGFLVLAVVYVSVRHHRGQDVKKTALGPARPEDVDTAALLRAEDYVNKNYSTSSLNRFARLLTETSAYLSRVDEKMELDGRVGKIATNLVFRRASTDTSDRLKERIAHVVQAPETEPVGSDDVSLVPLATLRKGLLFDGFVAYEQSGRRLPTLSQWEIRGLLLTTLRALFLRALSASSGTIVTELTNPRHRHVLLQVARDTVCATAGKDRLATTNRVELALAKIDELDPGGFDVDWKARIKAFCSSLARDYVIVVETKVADQANFSLRYEYVTTAAAATKGIERVRAKHGLAPVVVDASMTWALLPDSYHFELTAPPGQYIYDHHLERLASSDILRQNDFTINDVQQYVRVTHEQGKTIAHLYIRRIRYGDVSIDSSDEVDDVAKLATDFKSVIRLEEIPPGTLGSAVTVALFTAVILVYFAFVRQSGIVESPPSSTQLVPALLLGFPAFLAAALGRGITSDGVRRTSLVTFYGLWAFVATSALAVLLYLYDATRIPGTNIHLAMFGFDRRINLVWALLALFSVIAYLFLRKEKSDQRRYYLSILKQSALASQTKRA